MADGIHPAARRLADALVGAEDPVDALARASGADLTSFLLEVARRRAAAVTPAELVRRLRADRLVEPGTVDGRALHHTIAALLEAWPAAFEFLELSPVAPLGTCSTVATVDQKKIVSTMRGVEVAADPTNTLAVAAASRPESEVRLGAVQRILRTQPFGDVGQQHFTVLGVVIAGRDRGNLDFERTSLTEMLTTVVDALGAAGVGPIELRLTGLRDRFTDALVETVSAARTGSASVIADPGRASGRGYYRDVCFKVVARPGRHEVEIGDGGFTDWTAQLTGDRKRRLLVAGLGVDRIASLVSA